MSEYSREQIQKRILKRMSSLWATSSTSQIDPVIRLMVEALSEDIFMLAGEVSALDKRLLEKVFYAMSPINELSARASHSIISIQPDIAHFKLMLGEIFSYRDSRALRKYDVTSLNFSTISSFDIYKANLALIHINDKLYQYHQSSFRSSIAYVPSGNILDNSSVWIGIDSSISQDFENLSLYFDFNDVEDKSQYLSLLSSIKIYSNNEQVSFKHGLPQQDKKTIAYQHDIYQDYRTVYDMHYITLDRVSTARKAVLPVELVNLYSEGAVSSLSNDLVWIKITFPYGIPSEVLNNLQVGINYVPIANIYKRGFSQTMNDTSVFMPLKSDNGEYFISMNSVSDSTGKEYERISTENYNRDSHRKGVYSLRIGGVERNSSTNDIKSTSLRLLDVLKDKSLFSNRKINYEVNKMLDDLLALIEKISDNIDVNSDDNSNRCYIIVDKSNMGELLSVDYYVTNGANINNFNPNGSLSSSKNSIIADEGIELINPFRGGVNQLSMERTRDLGRYMLTSNDRIFTKSDILNYCKYKYGDHILSVRVSQGSAIDLEKHRGLIKTTDIHIKLKEESVANLPIDEFKIELLGNLKSKSPDTFNYRVIIE